MRIMRERGVAFVDVYNFRDLGGYRTIDGNTVVWQRLYRSDDLGRLREGDMDHFASLGIRTVVDLRRPNEVADLGRIPQLDGVTYHHVHMAHPPWPSQQFADTAERTAFVVERYQEMSVASGAAIGEALRLIADEDSAPLVFHCIAGKDRTGIVSALTLSLLGVDDETIADDYALSEAAEPQAWAYYARIRPGVVRPAHITLSPREAMLTFLEELRATHGSVQKYASTIGVTDEHVAAMRDHLLERQEGHPDRARR
jgi:protein-tyrosine phosphatase